jgi:hypothetical protein
MLTDDERKTIEAAADELDGSSVRKILFGPLAAKLRAIAAPRVATVGELLATARERGIVEFHEGSWWMQLTVFGGIVRWRVHDVDDGWHPYIDDPSSWHCDEFVAFWMAKPARLIPASEADLDPSSTRGPIGEG